jgi:hypothetical protein
MVSRQSTEPAIQQAILTLNEFSTLRYSLDLLLLARQMRRVNLAGRVRNLTCVATHTYIMQEY